MNAIGIDYGEARMGVAGTDALGILAHPLETAVLGLPVREDGTEGAAAEKVRKFAELLRTHLPPGTAVEFQDEYRSTVTAAENLRASGKRTKSHRPVIDQAAAVVILREWMEIRRPAGEPEL